MGSIRSISDPLWVADMDFESPPCVLNAMKNRVKHGIFGYTHAPNNFKENIADYVKKHYDWEFELMALTIQCCIALFNWIVHKIPHSIINPNQFIIILD